VIGKVLIYNARHIKELWNKRISEEKKKLQEVDLLTTKQDERQEDMEYWQEESEKNILEDTLAEIQEEELSNGFMGIYIPFLEELINSTEIPAPIKQSAILSLGKYMIFCPQVLYCRTK